MQNCSVFNCFPSESNKNCPELSFHEFPSNGPLRKKWIESIPDFKPNSNTSIMDRLCVCSLHFQKDDFEIGLPRRLKKDAIPSIFSVTPQKNYSKISKNVNNLKEPKPVVNPTILQKTEIVFSVFPPIKNYSKTSSVSRFKKVRFLENPIILGVPAQNEPVSSISTGHVNNLNKPLLPDNLFVLPQMKTSSTKVPFSQISSSIPNFQSFIKKPDWKIRQIMNYIPKTTCSMNEKDVYSQTEFQSETAIELENNKLRHRNLLDYREIDRLNQRISSLQSELEMHKKKAMICTSNRFHKTMDIISKDAQDPEKEFANIILDQVQNYSKECPRYSVKTVRMCGSWFLKFPDSYNHVIKENIIKLPSTSTLLSFVNHVSSKIDSPSDTELNVEEK